MTYQHKLAQQALALQGALESEEDAEIRAAEEAEELTWQALELFEETLSTEGEESWTQ